MICSSVWYSLVSVRPCPLCGADISFGGSHRAKEKATTIHFWRWHAPEYKFGEITLHRESENGAITCPFPDCVKSSRHWKAMKEHLEQSHMSQMGNDEVCGTYN